MVDKYNTQPNTILVAKTGSFKLEGESFSESALKYPLAKPDFLPPIQDHLSATVREGEPQEVGRGFR